MKSSIPRYQLVRSLLRTRLQREFVPGGRLPSEVELARAYSVSRVTVQQALGLLEKDGVIRRDQGRGTFYLGEGARRAEVKLSGLLESVMKYRDNAFARVLGKQVVSAPPRVAQNLQVPPHSPVVSIERVGIIDEVPIILINAWLPHELGARILQDDDDLSQKKTIVAILEDKYGIRVASVLQTIGATLADPAFAHHLGVEPASPLLEVERIYLDVDGRPVNFSTAFYRSDLYRFEVAMKEWR